MSLTCKEGSHQVNPVEVEVKNGLLDNFTAFLFFTIIGWDLFVNGRTNSSKIKKSRRTNIEYSPGTPFICLIIFAWRSIAVFTISIGSSIFHCQLFPTGFVWCLQQKTHLLAHAKLGVASMHLSVKKFSNLKRKIQLMNNQIT